MAHLLEKDETKGGKINMGGGASAAGERAPPGERASGGACREGAASGPDSPDGTGRRSSVRSCDSGREYAHWPPGYFTFSVLFHRIKLATVLLRGWLALK
jgi:hypothetical protein